MVGLGNHSGPHVQCLRRMVDWMRRFLEYPQLKCSSTRQEMFADRRRAEHEKKLRPACNDAQTCNRVHEFRRAPNDVPQFLDAKQMDAAADDRWKE